MMMCMTVFKKCSDEQVNAAVESVINDNPELPSVADIRIKMQAISLAHRVPKYQELPFSKRGGELPGHINDAINKIKDHSWKAPLSQELIEFARRWFPDITEDCIRKNYCEFSSALENSKEKRVEWQGVTGTEIAAKEVLHIDKFGNVTVNIQI